MDFYFDDTTERDSAIREQNIKLEEKLHDWKTNWKMQKKLAQICTEV